jgi:hypothetical protein
MMQVVKKWRIIIHIESPHKDTILYPFIIYDNFYSNMLRKLQEISFDSEPTKVEIELASEPTKVEIELAKESKQEGVIQK